MSTQCFSLELTRKLTRVIGASYPVLREARFVSLQYNVSTLLREPVGSTREYDIDDEALIREERQHIVGRASFLRTALGVLVTAHLEGVAVEQCSRCVIEIRVPIAMDFSEEFHATAQAETGAPLPPPEDPEAFRIDAKHTLDLEEAVRQFWRTALPMQPLCRPECRGLCPRCGQDWNAGPCTCQPEGDPRWSELGSLAGKLEGK